MKVDNWYRWMAAAVLGTAIIACPVRAQQAALDTPPADSPDDQQAEPTFEVNIQAVTVPVTVTDSSGQFVTDLNEKDFRIQDNGKAQKIENFELSFEPISMVIVVETSKRVEGDLPEVARSGVLFTQLILGESGEAAVISFDRDVNILQDFTTQSEQIEGALKSLKAGQDGVRLSDALTRALFLLNRRPKERRKVIVVFSEARDNGSAASPGYVLRGAQQLGVSVYTITLTSVGSMFGPKVQQQQPSPYPPGVVVQPLPNNTVPTPDNLNQHYAAAHLEMLPIIKEMVSYGKNWLGGNPMTVLASATGAEEFSGGNGGETAEEALGKIGRELHNQYLLTYRPNNLDKDSFHTIQVQVMGRRVEVRTRPGYMYTRSNGAGSAPASKP